MAAQVITKYNARPLGILYVLIASRLIDSSFPFTRAEGFPKGESLVSINSSRLASRRPPPYIYIYMRRHDMHARTLSFDHRRSLELAPGISDGGHHRRHGRERRRAEDLLGPRGRGWYVRRD